jgi:hypothetical protein
MDLTALSLRFKSLSLSISKISIPMRLTTKNQTKAPRQIHQQTAVLTTKNQTKAPRQIHQQTAVLIGVRVNVLRRGLSRTLGL